MKHTTWVAWAAPIVLLLAVGAGTMAQPAVAPPTDEELAEVAVGYIKADKNEFAWETLRTVLARTPGHFRANYAAGMLALQEQRHDEAARYLQAALRTRPDHEDAALTLGAAFQGVRKFASAHSVYRALLERSPNHAGAHHNLGILYIRHSEFAKAKPHLEAYVRLAPTAEDRAAVVEKIRQIDKLLKGR